MADSQDGEEHLLDELGAFYSARKQGSAQKKMRVRQKDTGVDICPNCQNWNNLGNRINNIVLDDDAKYKINMHESTLT